MAKLKLTKQKIIEAIPKAHGVKEYIASELGVNRRTVYRYFEKYPDLEQETQEYLDSVSDVAEHYLIEAVRAGNSWAVRYWLSTRGKNRGYTTKQEAIFNSSNPMQTIGIKIDGQPMQEITTGVADSNE